MWRGRPVWAEIDLGAIEGNVAALLGRLPATCGLMAVVKANAYGHGAVQAARAALAGGASSLAVNVADEGVQLRRAGVGASILVLGYIPPWEADKVVFHSLTPTVNTYQLALALAASSHWHGVRTGVHVKVDTGLSRYGLPPEEVLGFVRGLTAMPNLGFEGLWTHLATADETDKSFANQQMEAYQHCLHQLEAAGLAPRHRHVANSAGIIDLPGSHLDLVRSGIAIYGLYPSAEVDHSVRLIPAMALKGVVARVRRLPAGSSVGYGRTYIAERDVTVALVPAGYGDGLRRSLSNLGEVLIHGRRARILGRVSMDQIVVDITDIPGVSVGDEVVLLGRQGEGQVTAEELADWMGTINYEVVTGISQRVPRVYLRDGEVVAAESLVD
ncbi:MAG: alanine racemase [Dehalococcoidales bacterium]|nr:alanine racemase [Dehalococcoidales bacterium]